MPIRAGDQLVSSRLLILQSKRMLLTGAKRKMNASGSEQARADVGRYEAAVAQAHARYNETVLRWGSADTAQYRLIAYGSLIVKAERLRASLLVAGGPMSPADRRELISDVAVLNSIIANWRGLSRQSMLEAVA